MNTLATALAGVPLGWLEWVKDGPGDHGERYREAMQNAATMIVAEYERVARLAIPAPSTEEPERA